MKNTASLITPLKAAKNNLETINTLFRKANTDIQKYVNGLKEKMAAKDKIVTSCTRGRPGGAGRQRAFISMGDFIEQPKLSSLH